MGPGTWGWEGSAGSERSPLHSLSANPDPRSRAKLLLKKKRYQEQLLDKTDQQIASLESMVGAGPWAACRVRKAWAKEEIYVMGVVC